MKKRTDDQMNMHILLIHDRKKGVHIANCLEMDLAAQGKTQKEVLENLKECIRMQLEFALENGSLDTVFRSAPPEEWAMFYKAWLLNAQKNLSLYPHHTAKNLLSNLLKNPEIAYA